MAEHKQDLITFNDDTFKIRYTFSSIQNQLGVLNEAQFVFDSAFGAFWSAGLNSDWPTIPSMVRSKGTVNWTYAIAFSPHDSNIDVISDTTIIDVNFNQSDFTGGGGQLQPNTEYYTELVISNKANQSTSIVAATGLLYVSASVFSAASYRP